MTASAPMRSLCWTRSIAPAVVIDPHPGDDGDAPGRGGDVQLDHPAVLSPG